VLRARRKLVGRASLARWSQRAGAPPDRLTAALAEARRSSPVASRRSTGAPRSRSGGGRYFLCGRDDPRKDALADAFVGRIPVPPELAARLAAMRLDARRGSRPLGACGFKFLRP